MKVKLKGIIGAIILGIFVTTFATGCGDDTMDEHTQFIYDCNQKPNCHYSVMKDSCICDNSNTYTPAP